MFLFFTLRLSNLVTLNTTKRKERYGTEVNTVQFIETSDFARNSNFLQIFFSSLLRKSVPKFEFDLIDVETREAKDRILSRINFFFFYPTQRKFNLRFHHLSQLFFFFTFFSPYLLITFFFLLTITFKISTANFASTFSLCD